MDLVDRFARSRALFGDGFERIKTAKIIIFGIGGVGGFALDALYRSGASDLTVVDADRFDITNQNRQLHSENIGEYKVDIAHQIYGAKKINKRIDKEWVEAFDFSPYDLVLDAIDDIPAKVSLAKNCHKKLISSMGAAKRIDPMRIKVSKISKTSGDKFTSIVKKRLKYENINCDYTVIYSDEEPIKCADSELGSFMGVTGAFGLTMASVAIKRLICR